MKSRNEIAAYAGRFVSLTDEEEAIFCAAFKKIKIKKKQFIVQPNFIAKHRYYIIKGAFRAYVVDEDGQEHTIQLSIEDWWISDYNSFLFQQPASMFVVALEDSDVLQIDYESEVFLKNHNHKFETFFRTLAERTAAFMQRRIISHLTKSAEARYDDFINKYPLIAQRVPQYAIASFLGFSKEFLSRLRKKKAKN